MLDEDDLIDLTRGDLYRQTQEVGIDGRSDMSRDELARALTENG